MQLNDGNRNGLVMQVMVVTSGSLEICTKQMEVSSLDQVGYYVCKYLVIVLVSIQYSLFSYMKYSCLSP